MPARRPPRAPRRPGRPVAGRARRAAAAGAVVAGLAALAGCGGPPGLPAPGHGTPAAAAVGFLESYGGRDPAAACRYALPAQATTCTAALRSGARLSVRQLGVGAVTVQGDRALVSITGTLCVARRGQPADCAANHDRHVGQPASPGAAAFTRAYDAVERGSSSRDNTAVPCTRSGGRWYVDLGS